jgi:hypothetical protein
MIVKFDEELERIKRSYEDPDEGFVAKKVFPLNSDKSTWWNYVQKLADEKGVVLLPSSAEVLIIEPTASVHPTRTKETDEP